MSPPKQLPSNYTASEILRAVEIQYPDLKGSLLDMYNLLCNELATIEADAVLGDGFFDELSKPRVCEHCGSSVEHKYAR